MSPACGRVRGVLTSGRKRAMEALHVRDQSRQVDLRRRVAVDGLLLVKRTEFSRFAVSITILPRAIPL
jgi:hypothetical protein